MKKFFKISGWVLLFLIATAVALYLYFKPPPPPISAKDRARVKLMPLPASLEFETGSFEITETFGIGFENEPTDKLTKAVARFKQQVEKSTRIKLKDADEQKLHIVLHEIPSSEYPQLGDDESYELSVSKDKILLKAGTTTGVLYGLETLAQLIDSKDNHHFFPAVEIKDQPRYAWRGLMLDVSRHWIPKEVVLRNLEAMARLKMNVFHWHLSDYQGFRVESKVFPKLHEMGSEGHYYSQNDIKEIVNFAAERGIRVIPEFDVPGHATSWLTGYPELGSAPGPYAIDTIALGVFRPVLDPTNPSLYSFLDDFIAEMITLFPDPYFHIGGDEVMAEDWENNEAIQNYMKENGISDSHALQAHFNIKLQRIVSKHNKIMMGWDEIQHPDLPTDGIAIQAWRSHKVLWESARKGNKSILSKGYYLDHKRSAADYYNVDPEIIKGAINIDIDSTNWTSWNSQIVFNDNIIDGNIYTFGKDDDIQIIMEFMGNSTSIAEVDKKGNSVSFSNKIDVGTLNVSFEINGDSLHGETSIALFNLKLTGKKSGGSDMTNGLPLPKFDKIQPLEPKDLKNILGGEACMWTEMVDSITLESRVWPKAAVIAEKLWSPQELTKDTDDMYRRLLIMDRYLEFNGLQQKKNQELILSAMVGSASFESLDFLVDYLQEGAFLNRISLYNPTLYTGTPLNGIVDAASSESYPAYLFNKKVDHWLVTKQQKE
ncbi:beta-N-acetylhexosaminidase, partial [Lutimonas sp.]|uniref:beta-N-acetylhexosaminidase n=1 Tax=Lutimonas sp. TaxID=1872403 RepID=UPI003D9BC182